MYVVGNSALVTIINNGTITGGAGGENSAWPANYGATGGMGEGGAAGSIRTGGSRGTSSQGGAGIIGENISVINNGTITGGIGGNGGLNAGAQNDAVTFQSGTNNLTLTTKSVINGVVSANGNDDTLTLQNTVSEIDGGQSDGTDISATQYKGFEHLVVNGGRWTVSGSAIVSGETTLNGGALVVTGPAALGVQAITAQGGAIEASGDQVLDQSFVLKNNPYGARTSGLVVQGADNLVLSGVLSDVGSLTKNGSGTLTLSGANTYTGGTTLTGGTLAAASDSNLGGASGGLTFNGGTLQVTGTGWTSTNRTVSLQAGGGTFNIDNATNNFAVMQGVTGAGGLTKSGAGTLTLSGANTYSGGTTVSAGILTLTGDNTGGGTTTVDAGAALHIGTGGTSGSLAGNIVNNGALVVNRSNALDLANVISGAGSLTKSGAGTLTLSGINTYTGGTTMTGGTVAAASDSNLGGASGGLTFNGGTLQVTGTGWTSTNRTVRLQTGGTFEIEDATNNFAVMQGVTGAGGLTKSGAGTLTLSGANTYTGGTTMTAGTLAVANDNNLGGASGGLVINDGATLQLTDNLTTARGVTLGAGTATITTDGGKTAQFSNKLTGSGTLAVSGSGTLILSAANDYSGNTTIANGSTLQLGDGSTDGSLAGNVANAGTFSFRNQNGTTFAGAISGAGSLVQNGTGALTLSGDSHGFAGTTTVSGSSLLVSGKLGGTVTVNSGATLGGSGEIGGNTTVNGTLAGASGSGLTFNGDLMLGSGSIINAAFDRPGGARIFDVTGNIALNGTVNVSSFGTGGPGLYHLFHYAGTSSGSGLALGTLPSGVSAANVYINQQANDLYVVNTNGATLNYWNGTQTGPQGDGQLHGGDGTWTAATGSFNWTNSPGYDLNGAWTNDGFAVFGGAKGLVTVDTSAGAISASGMQFITTGYKLSGGTLTLVPTTGGSTAKPVIRVGSGSPGDSALIAIISTELTGTHGLEKADGGTLILTGANSYTGGTAISGGTLQLGDGATNGSVLGAISTSTDAAHKGVLAIHAAAGTPATIGNIISGEGSVSVLGGKVTLSGANSYTGGTTVSAGILTLTGDNTGGGTTTVNVGAALHIGTGGTSGSLAGNIVNNGALVVNRSDALNLAGAISGTGSLTKNGAGTLTLSGANTYTGGTTMTAGTLAVANDNNLGGASGGLVINDGATLQLTDNLTTARGVTLGAGTATITTDGGKTAQFSNKLTGSGTLAVSGSGTLILSAANDYSGNTTIANGSTLQLGDGSTDGSLAGNVANAGTFSFRNQNGTTFAGAISGAGSLVQNGTGALTLSGDSHGFAGTTTVSGSSLLVSGKLGGTVTVNSGAMLGGSGEIVGNTTVNGTLEGTSGNGLTFNGDLMLGSGSIINAAFDRPGGARIFDVTGNIALNGTVNVSSFGTGGPGLYHLFHYAGTSSGSGLALGTLPSGVSAANVYINQQANDLYVVNTNGATLNYWNGTQTGPQGDGQLHGGNGTWTAATGSFNWTNSPGYDLNGAWTNDGFAVFGGAKGLVTVDTSAGAISASGMQFITTGYKLSGGTLTLVPTTGSSTAKPVIRVGSGSPGDSALIATISTELTGTHGLEKADGGTLILTGANTYTGGTAISGGTLQLGDGTTNGSVLGAISTSTDATHKGVLAIRAVAGTPATIGNIISGEGSVSVLGGTVTLSGVNTYTGGTTVSAGILTLTGDNTGGGTTTVDAGAALHIGTGGTSGSLAGNIVNNGALVVNRSNALDLAGVISGTGSLTKSGAGTLTLSGINTYTGGTTMTGGTVAAASDSNLGGASGGLTFNGGTLQVTGTGWTSTNRTVRLQTGGTFEIEDATNNFAVMQGVTGAGGLTKSGAGTLTLSGANTYTGGTTVTAGTLAVANDNNLGGASGGLAINDGATLQLTDNLTTARGVTLGAGTATITTDGGKTAQFSNKLTGSGTLAVSGSGTLILSAANDYSGNTTIANGSTLQLGDGSTDGSLAGNVANAGTFSFRNQNGTTFAGAISGAGSLVQNGTGALTLSGDSHGFAGTTTVSGSSLLVSGKLGGTVTVNSGAMLGGSGEIVGNTTVNGTLEGTSGNGLTFNGDLMLGSGSIINAAFDRPGGARIFDVTGNIALNGTVNVSSFGTGGPGLYHLFHYAGTSSGSGLALGTLPSGVSAANVYINQQANDLYVVNTNGATLNYWNGTQTGPQGDGQLHGGNGTWTAAAGSFNWTNSPGYDLNGAWTNDGFAVFGGAKGLVTVDTSAGAISASGMQFITTGYKLSGGTLTLVPTTGSSTAKPVIRVGSGSPGDSALIATISTELTGTHGLEKADGGTLILTGANTYTGGTAISGGTLQLGDGTTNGSVLGAISTSTDATHKGVLAIRAVAGTPATIGNIISGEGSVSVLGGTVTLSGVNTYTGGTTVSAGILTLTGDNTGGGTTTVDAGAALHIGTGGTSGSLAGNIVNNGALVVNRSNALDLANVISGTGSLTKSGAGTLTLSGANTYTGGTTVTAGTLAVANDNNLGGASGGLVINDGATLQLTDNLTTARGVTLGAGTATITTDGGKTAQFSNKLTGSGTLAVSGSGTLILSAANDYSGNTTIANGSTLQLGDGSTDGSLAGNVANAGTLTFHNQNGTTFAGEISGAGSLVQNGTGALTLSGDSQSFAGTTTVSGSSLLVSGKLGGTVTVNSGAMLGGSGEIVGNTTVNGTLEGTSGSGLTFNGDLMLGSGSIINAAFDRPGGTRIFDVTGNIVLDGTVNVSSFGTGGPGLYHLFHYAGTSSGSGLALGTLPSGVSAANVYINQQANDLYVVNTNGATLNYWNGTQTGPQGDGQLHGGNGTWTAATGSFNWTNSPGYDLNGAWTNDGFAVFGGAKGQVTVDTSAGAISASGMQFITTGYKLSGGTLTLVPTTGGSTAKPVIRVGSGSPGDSALIAIISTELTGTHGLEKADGGTLILTGANSYTGGTAISGGTLQLGDGATNGSVLGAISTSTDATHKGVLAIHAAAGTPATIGNIISGEGSVSVLGGKVTLSGANSYTGGTTVSAGILTLTGDNTGGGTTTVNVGAALHIGTGGTSGSLAGNIVNNGALVVNRSDALNLAGAISGTGSLTKNGAGTLTLSGANTYTGGTTMTAGTLAVANDNNLGGASGGLVINDGATLQLTDNLTTARGVTLGAGTATITTDGGKTAQFSNKLTGSGTLAVSGSGTLILSAANDYSGNTTIANGSTLQLGDGSTDGSLAGNVANAGTFSFRNQNGTTFAGAISGAGSLVQNGTGALTLSGDSHGFAGTTTVSGSSLLVTGKLGGTVTVNSGATLGGSGEIGGNTTVNGTLAGASGSGLTFNGDLMLGSGSIINAAFDRPGGTRIFDVTGNIALNGTVNVSSFGTAARAFITCSIMLVPARGAGLRLERCRAG
ncbi:autotransporter-associated beta strand repeat-containing protein [Brucella sp. 10RB9215]|uniref:autotransporter-associated beta strand repeat-containing protein n=1 Tax=Brucella sp. 10RB9215 TaxID=1149953 RepID=UPI001FCF14C6|nr:autotransporter-associated beta strand repeat-containing protein [Brucella sp. 10RB9215]